MALLRVGLRDRVGEPLISADSGHAGTLEEELRRLSMASSKAAPLAADEGNSQSLRFSAKGLASQRQRLGLSAGDVELLLDA